MDDKRLIDYILATANLYGIVPYEQVAKLYSEQNEESISPSGIAKLLEAAYTGSLMREALEKEFVYEYGDGFFVGQSILVFHEFDVHWLAQQGKPYYEPPKEELLKWKDSRYIERPEEAHELQRYIEANFEGVDSKQAMGMVRDFQLRAEDSFSMDKVFNVFCVYELEFEGKWQAKEVRALVARLYNNTRIQNYRGHTPKELFELKKKRLLSLDRKKWQNDLCPCGSGKKYKKCCGKIGWFPTR